jgi:hypothetical protein
MPPLLLKKLKPGPKHPGRKSLLEERAVLLLKVKLPKQQE